ncbi:hypothetical protein J6590_077881 [Homalodisca vitripennis]|nr:hypothetical protein J6590_077881 [Homalodisca vitripennis]
MHCQSSPYITERNLYPLNISPIRLRPLAESPRGSLKTAEYVESTQSRLTALIRVDWLRRSIVPSVNGSPTSGAGVLLGPLKLHECSTIVQPLQSGPLLEEHSEVSRLTPPLWSKPTGPFHQAPIEEGKLYNEPRRIALLKKGYTVFPKPSKCRHDGENVVVRTPQCHAGDKNKNKDCGILAFSQLRLFHETSGKMSTTCDWIGSLEARRLLLTVLGSLFIESPVALHSFISHHRLSLCLLLNTK